jgi:hypothetical protein
VPRSPPQASLKSYHEFYPKFSTSLNYFYFARTFEYNRALTRYQSKYRSYGTHRYICASLWGAAWVRN